MLAMFVCEFKNSGQQMIVYDIVNQGCKLMMHVPMWSMDEDGMYQSGVYDNE